MAMTSSQRFIFAKPPADKNWSRCIQKAKWETTIIATGSAHHAFLYRAEKAVSPTVMIPVVKPFGSNKKLQR